MGQKTLKNPIDEHVGSRVRTRRLILNMSQQTLGEAVGVAYQQIQKYETGANRIGASRMQQFSNILQVPVSFFFDGSPNPKANGHSLPHTFFHQTTSLVLWPRGRGSIWLGHLCRSPISNYAAEL
jgi:transcriptional regulator with XRE-family HTH domain